jgi:phosphoribosyl 1,2-cyclic phosphodiesterase
VKFIQHYSGSAGNLYEVVAGNGARIIIDPGVRWELLIKALNYELDNIEACLVSHSHLDHCKSALNMMNNGIATYVSAGALEAMDKVRLHRNSYLIKDEYLCCPNFDIGFFSTFHDAPDPLGFIIKENATKNHLLFATDTSHIRQSFKIPFRIIAIECSYDRDLLDNRVLNKTINETLAKRLLESHMEKSVAMNYIKNHCALWNCEELHLLHMSESGIDKEATRKEFEDEFMIRTFCL